ncbi:MAG: type IX secretion system membrane protein PorP/SprF [Flavobacteriales bacterium]|nr:type IX secretion system membrane protein PorP/SprF [Flavobacteriales bacterium]MCB9447913.1 type IX secretion system membrane protein PorP/SprF [Flavobacteriales bacterium]
MKKTLFILFALCLSVVTAQAQQWLLSGFLSEQPMVFNPAVAGTDKEIPVTLSHRSQWQGLEGAPSTQILTIHGSVNKIGGLGLSLLNDQTGPARQVGAQLAYSYRLKVREGMQLAFGIAPMIFQHHLDLASLTTDEANDPLLAAASESALTFDANAGLYVFTDQFSIGFSIPQLLKSKMYFGEDEITSRLHRHYILHGNYTHKINDKFTLQPSAVLRYAYSSPGQGDILVRGIYQEKFFLTAGARISTSTQPTDALLLQGGVKYNQFTLGYGYDYAFTTLHQGSSGSHEIVLRYNIPGDVKKIKEDESGKGVKSNEGKEVKEGKEVREKKVKEEKVKKEKVKKEKKKKDGETTDQ